MASDPPPPAELLRGYIESHAVDLRPDHDGQIRLSIAISLKRIADALTPDDPRNSFIYKALAEPLNAWRRYR